MQANAPSTQLDAVPRGAVQYNGMLYFAVPTHHPAPSLPPSLPAPPPPPPAPQPQPPVIFTNPWEGWQLPYAPATVGYTPIAVQPPTWPGAAVGFSDTFSSNRPPTVQHFMPQLVRPQGLPVPEYPEEAIPRQMSLSMNVASYAYRPTEEAAPTVPLSVPMPKTRAFSTPADDFPYVPPKEQRNGHARRISVSTKSVNREAMDALGLDSPTTSGVGRLPWQTHSDRLARRVSVHSCGFISCCR